MKYSVFLLFFLELFLTKTTLNTTNIQGLLLKLETNKSIKNLPTEIGSLSHQTLEYGHKSSSTMLPLGTDSKQLLFKLVYINTHILSKTNI